MNDSPKQESISILSKRVGPLSLRGWLFILLVALTALYFYKSRLPDISNAEYVETLRDKGTLERTAGAFVRDVRPEAPANQSSADKAADDAKWKGIATDLAKCMERQAKEYLASGDPYLEKRFSRETPRIVSKRLLEPCDVMKYLPPPKKEE